MGKNIIPTLASTTLAGLALFFMFAGKPEEAKVAGFLSIGCFEVLVRAHKDSESKEEQNKK